MATANPTRTRRASSAGSGTGPTTTRTEKGISLARGPALILGTILTAVGLYLLYKAHTFPPFSDLPNGNATADGKFIFGLFEANGWTAMLTAVGGALLLFGAAQHLLAKTMSLIVGIALGAAAVIALISGNVLGMAAANGWTELGWAICSVILLFNTLVPRRRRTVEVADDAAVADEPAVSGRRTVPAEDAGYRDEPVADRTETREPVAADEGAARREPLATRDAAAEDRTAVREPAGDRTAVREDA